MEFADFITAFGNGYKAQWRKEDFCKALLCSIAKDENMVIYENGKQEEKYKRGSTTFQSYYRNGKRRSIRPIAVCIHNNLDLCKFKRFLDTYTAFYSKQTLFADFNKYYPDITEENLFDKITDSFVEIIKAACNEPDKRRRPPMSSQIYEVPQMDKISLSVVNDATVSDTNDVESLIKYINETIGSLITTGRRIAEFNNRCVADNTYYSKLKSKLHTEHEQLYVLYEKLSDYNEIHSNSIIEQILISILQLEENNFILSTNEFIITSRKNYHIHRLRELISKFQAEKDDLN